MTTDVVDYDNDGELVPVLYYVRVFRSSERLGELAAGRAARLFRLLTHPVRLLNRTVGDAVLRPNSWPRRGAAARWARGRR